MRISVIVANLEQLDFNNEGLSPQLVLSRGNKLRVATIDSLVYQLLTCLVMLTIGYSFIVVHLEHGGGAGCQKNYSRFAVVPSWTLQQFIKMELQVCLLAPNFSSTNCKVSIVCDLFNY